MQVQNDLGWDQELLLDQKREWANICKQINAFSSVSIPRFMGKSDSTDRLIAFTDSSKLIYGAVIFVQDLCSNVVSFLIAKNKIVNDQLKCKSIPSSEFMGIVLGTCQVLNVYVLL